MNAIQKIMLVFLFIIIQQWSNAQNEITWNFSYNDNSKQIEMTATLQHGWHVYSTNLGGIPGPIPTEFQFQTNKDVKFVGKVQEPEPKIEFDPNFEETVKYFDEKVVFKQNVRSKGKNTTVNGSVVYMICNDKMCLPPVEKQFVVNLKK